MEGWGKIGVQSASVLYPNSCYNESCYIEVQVYILFHHTLVCLGMSELYQEAMMILGVAGWGYNLLQGHTKINIVK